MTQTLRRSPADGGEVAAPAKPKFRTDIQGLRALAVGVVVAYHTGLALPGGYVGVDMFFVISGFVITRQVLWEHETSGALDLKQFYLRRIRRIVPALTFMVVVVAVLSPVLGPLADRSTARATALGATFVNANNYLAGLFGSVHLTSRGGEVVGLNADYFDRRTELNPFLHTWSLSVEEQFYLVFPLVIAGAGFIGLRRGTAGARTAIFMALSAVGVVSFGAALWVMGFRQELAFFLAPLRAWEFVAGALLVATEGRLLSRIGALAVGAVGLIAIVLNVQLYSTETVFPGVAAVLPVVATMLLIQAGSMGANPVSSMLSTPSAVYVGTISYSWYLWHWPFIIFAIASAGGGTIPRLIAVALSLVVAGLSTTYLEDRIRRKVATPYETIRLFIVCLALSVGAIQLAGFISSQPSLEQDFNAFFPHHETSDLDCSALPAIDEGCVFDVEGESVGSALLVGDSNAEQMIEGVVEGFNREGYAVTVAYLRGCPFVTATVYLGDDEFTACRTFAEDVISAASENPFDVIVFANATEIHVTNTLVSVVAADGTQVSTPSAKAELLEASAISSLEQLASSGSEVVVVQSIPKLVEWNESECSSFAYRFRVDSCSISVPLEQTVEERVLGDAIERAMAERTNAVLVSFDEVLCGGGECSAFDDGMWRWRDSGHISVAQSEALAGSFAALVAE